MITKLSMDVLNSLTISEMDVLKYIESNKLVVLDMSVHDLALKTYVSTATIMRLCKKIGFSGFTEFKYCLKDEIQLKEAYYENESFEKIIKNNINSMIETSKLLDEKDVNQVVEWMKEEKKIHLFAKGLTSTITEYVSKQLMTFSRENYNYKDTHIAYLAAEKMTENDLVILCSLSGCTHQLIRMGQIAKGCKAKVVTITGYGGNDLSKIGDVNFHICIEESSHSRYDIESRLPMLLILNVIISLYVQNK